METTRPAYDPAPVPNQDAAGPSGESVEYGNSLGPTVIQPPRQSDQPRSEKPGLGLSLHMPTQ